jgi:uncharacterized membrane protein YhiD involved in acid resistance
VRGLTTAASLWATAAIGAAVGAGYLFGAAVSTALATATLYALRSFRSTFIYPLRLDSAGLEITLGDPDSGPQDALEVLRRPRHLRHAVDAEIDEERARYKREVRIPPPHDVHPALAELTDLPEVARVSLTGLRYFE